ncbi:putative acyl-coenzyme A:6-aminopenicillanic-acid-acyltransferase 40 kDa form [Coniochaeta ligniaria NRRL 30616]|uniref:Putative acyl-coenzyme A:6-aminopenicillanic-acid-acyltransferase 40 kDa form n=1 Tax=Coniochaeta ligniaria NRRL 30616 TaxID=1408157 RepID=A0A1J7I5S0_9PEZI|nr:putative acyl-coenzyme A:6-aminopenicillanic-acid-acyltransferase 40 kDa form [Coniochaeta ligniaria NRRL 30616]
MIHIHCSGSPFEIGQQHGTTARQQIIRSLAFYADYFLSKSGMDWSSAVAAAGRFQSCLDEHCPHLVEEMRGIAAGAGVDFGDILALNVRTEISMGMGLSSDGCTSLFYKPQTHGHNGILAQNWDWETAQQENLVALHIKPNSALPALSIVTESGIIGKIGMNECGVGVCLNAIRAKAVNYAGLPVHVALRSVLESKSREEAINRLCTVGVAASCHILVADPDDGTGLECSYADIVPLSPSGGIYTHTNHWLMPHAGPEGPITESIFLPDSVPRLVRLNSLIGMGQDKVSLSAGGDVSHTETSRLEEILEDEQNFPGSINKSVSPTSSVATLFSIVMDLAARRASVRIGRPTQAVDSFILDLA